MAIGMKPSNNETKDSTNKDSTNKVECLVDKNVTQKSNKNTIIIIAVVAVIVIIIIAMLKSLMTPEEPIEMTDTGQVDGTTQEAATTTAQGATTEYEISTEVAVGLPEFDDRENGSTSATVYSANDYIKDLNGNDIPAVYNVASRSYVKDFANYEAKRAILADGMEMYWLEIQYKNKPYRCQVPYYVFKDLETTGICVVEIEVLTLEGGEQVISYMQVVTNYEGLGE